MSLTDLTDTQLEAWRDRAVTEARTDASAQAVADADANCVAELGHYQCRIDGLLRALELESAALLQAKVNCNRLVGDNTVLENKNRRLLQHIERLRTKAKDGCDETISAQA